MIHDRHLHGPPKNGPSDEGSSLHRATTAATEASLSQLRRAKRAADESLRRAQDAPEPHTSDNSIFVALWEAHLSDREALFAAMRRLDEVHEALRSSATGTGQGDSPADTIDRHKVG
ncbi:MAG: hypothetical protein WBA88_00710 [Pseudaminobacter sp.]